MAQQLSSSTEGGAKRQCITLADRLSRLGTETAYNISRDANALSAQGKKIYGMHIGDLNFTPPEAFTEEVHRYYKMGKTNYCLARGVTELREAVARRVLADRGVKYASDEVAIQAGGKPTILKFLLALMNEGDRVMYPSPGYPLYESLINFLGGVAVPYSYKVADEELQLDMDDIKEKMKSNVKLFIINNMHNPTGYVSPKAELEEIAQLCVSHNLTVLSDEAYCSIFFDERPQSIVSLPGMQERTVLLLTCSKEWAMTGIRLGAAVGPKSVIDVFEKLAINDEGCVCQPSQWAGVKLFDGACDEHTKNITQQLKTRRDLLHKRLTEVRGFKPFLPKATFFMWVDATEAARILGTQTHEEFRLKLLNDTGISFCTREHFGACLPNERTINVRFSFAGISESFIEEAMAVLRSYMEKQGQ